MTVPGVSVLMPVRDAARWLRETVASLFAQTETCWELIAVDDGSGDGSLDLLTVLAAHDERIRVFATGAERRGIVSALNLGLDEVRAPLVARMDADDCMHPRRLEVQSQALDDDPGLFATTCRVQAVPKQSLGEGMRRYLDWQNSLVEPEDLARERFIESPLLHPTAMMRTPALREQLGGWNDAGWPEDWDLFLRAFELGMRFRRVPRSLYRWRLHAGQATRCDSRYDEAAFRRARAHYLARHMSMHADGRETWILGAGPVGKKLGKALAREGAAVGGFADIDAKKIGGHVRDGDKIWPVIDTAALEQMRSRVLAIASVGTRGARDEIRGRLRSWGWLEGEDFLAAA